MAKKRRAFKPDAQSAAAPLRAVQSSKSRGLATTFLADADGRFPLRAYILMNVLFDGFCLLNLLFIRQTLRETRGLYFFFGLLMAGFFLVSVYDFLFDRLVTRAANEEADESGVAGA